MSSRPNLIEKVYGNAFVSHVAMIPLIPQFQLLGSQFWPGLANFCSFQREPGGGQYYWAKILSGIWESVGKVLLWCWEV
jgi:hypothetical protein